MVRPGKPTLLVLALVALAIPTAARPLGPISLTLEAWGGVQWTDPLLITGGTATATPTAQDRLVGHLGLVGRLRHREGVIP